MHLMQIGKIFGLGLEAGSEGNAEQELTLEEDLSFTEALETTQTLPEMSDESRLPEILSTPKDEADTEEDRDPLLYLQQFLQLDDHNTAAPGKKAQTQLQGITSQSAVAIDTKPVNAEQHSDGSLPLPELKTPSSEQPQTLLSLDAILENTPKVADTEQRPLKDILNEAAETASPEKPFVAETGQNDKESVGQDSSAEGDIEQVQTLGASELMVKNRQGDLSDATMTKLSGTESLSAPRAAESNAGSRTQTPEFNLHTPIHQDEWGDEFNQRILWLGQQKIDKALLQLHPKDLGPVQVQIHMQDNQAHLHIHVNDALVQQRIQDSLPELKALLEMQGLGLGQASIDSQNRGQQGGEQPQSMAMDVDVTAESVPSASSTRILGVTRDGHVDTYA